MSDIPTPTAPVRLSDAAIRRRMLREFWFYFSQNRGAVVGLTGLAWQGAWLVFAGLAVACVLVGRAVSRHRGEEPDIAMGLNDRGRQLIGKVFKLEATMAGGEGRIRVGDSSWRVTGPELLAGTEIRVVRVDGATLVVEKA